MRLAQRSAFRSKIYDPISVISAVQAEAGKQIYRLIDRRNEFPFRRKILEVMASGENYCTLLKRLFLTGVRRRRLLLILLVLYVVTTYFLRHSLWNVLERVQYKVTPLKEDLRTYRELIFLQVLFRHGHHSPFSSYPNDPISDSYWHEGMGQLTKLGRLQHYVVGKYLRDYYDGFLGYNVQEVDCLSSIAFRSLYGAYAFLAGLYPSPPGRKLDEELSWQPVPCSFLPLNKDKYLQSLPNCAAAELDKSAMFKSKEAMEFMAPYRKLYKFWTKHSGLNVTTYGDAGSLYKTLLAEVSHLSKSPIRSKKFLFRSTN
ncbi:prostatic acid phosphatase [Trichonephila clavata]|uniref:acid phosphatase n=1 Tax=Trichonephila clavata TaxID=2740835 RepID=A0A8X6GE34_TRICU|nr:prostatic acid phosphatase [Trichonephila clavata]